MMEVDKESFPSITEGMKEIMGENNLIDIHSHVIFGVDDGPKTIEETKSLLIEAYNQGVRTIVATSHRRIEMFETPEDKIEKNFNSVQKLAKEIASDLTILYGAEIYYSSDNLEKLEKKIIPSINGTSYVLIEFNRNISFWEIKNGLMNILRLGLTPIIAHVERYQAFNMNEDYLKEIINMGCYTQINSSSILKAKWFNDKNKVLKKRAKYFLDRDLVHCIASDMHHLSKRPPYMKDAFEIISHKYGRKKAKELFVDNPQLIITNQIIE